MRKKKENAYRDSYRMIADEDATVFSVKEAYKSIRTNLVLSVIKDGCKVITFTSAIPAEGKTTTAVNVAVSLAKAYFKVAIIDCDLMKPRVHRTLKVQNTVGLTNVLSGMSTYEEALQHVEKYGNLYVIPAGIAAPNPSEMLASERMGNLIERMKSEYDYIILDTPPVTVISDGLTLATRSDGTVLVVRQNYSADYEIKRAIHNLTFINAKIIGIVFNAIDEGGKYKYYSNKKKNGYGYGKYVDAKRTESVQNLEAEEEISVYDEIEGEDSEDKKQ